MLLARVLRLQKPPCRAAVTCIVRPWVSKPVPSPMYTRQAPATPQLWLAASNIRRCCATHSASSSSSPSSPPPRNTATAMLRTAITLWPQTQEAHNLSKQSMAASYQHVLSVCLSPTRASRRISKRERLAIAVRLLDEFTASAPTTTTSTSFDVETSASSVVTDMLHTILHACEPLAMHGSGDASSVATRVLLQYTGAGGDGDAGTVSAMHAAMAKLLPDTTVQPHSTRVPLSPELYTQLVRVWAKTAGRDNAAAFDAALALHAAAEQHHASSDASWPLVDIRNMALHACAQAAGCGIDQTRVRGVAMQLVRGWLEQDVHKDERPSPITYATAMKVLANAPAAGTLVDVAWLLERFLEEDSLRDADWRLVAAVLRICQQYNHMVAFRSTLFPLLAARNEAPQYGIRMRLEAALGKRATAGLLKTAGDCIIGSPHELRLRSMVTTLLTEAPHDSTTTTTNAAQLVPTLLKRLVAAGVPLPVREQAAALFEAPQQEPTVGGCNVWLRTILRTMQALPRREAAASASAWLQVAQELHQAMRDAGGYLRPDGATLATLMQCHAAAAATGSTSALPSAVTLLRDAQLVATTAQPGQFCEAPTREAYNSVLNTCLATARHIGSGDCSGIADVVAVAESLLSELQAARTAVGGAGPRCPSSSTYTPLLALHSHAVKVCGVSSAAFETTYGWRRCMELLREMQAMGGGAAPTRHSYTAVIDACANAVARGDAAAWQYPVRLLNEAARAGGEATPNTAMHNALLRACAAAAVLKEDGAWEMALEELQHMKHPDVHSYEAAIYACVGAAVDGGGGAQPLTKAVNLLPEATARGGEAAPNARMYSVVIKACATLSPTVPQALAMSVKLLHEMHAAGRVAAPNIVTYSAVIHAHAAAASKGDAAALKAAVALLRVAPQPDRTTYNIVIKACADAAGRGVGEAVETSKELLHEMVGRGGSVAPDQHTYSSVINTHANAAARGAPGDRAALLSTVVRLLREATARGGAAAPNVVMYTTALKACAQAARGGVEEALPMSMTLLQEMKDAGGALRPTVATYNAIIDVHASAPSHASGQPLHHAITLLQQALEAGGRARPTEVTYNSVLKACERAAKAGVREAAQVALSLLRGMVASSDPRMAPSNRTMSTVVRVCAADGSEAALRGGRKAVRYLCTKARLVPDAHTVSACLQLYVAAGDANRFLTMVLPQLVACGAQPQRDGFFRQQLLHRYGEATARRVVAELAAQEARKA